jgi:NitT/TauT family transport system ATP-binding protein
MGKKYVTSEVDKRKSILKSILANVEPFYSVIKAMKESRGTKMSKEDLENLTGEMFPSDDPESILKILMNWGRYARLIDFDSDQDEFSISP